ncbi:MAG: hypothetical protein WC465_04980 [Patescibacteria group bacterium]
MKQHKNIPQAFLAPVINTKWVHDEGSKNKFKQALEYHSKKDRESGYTCRYFLRDKNQNDMLTRTELLNMIKTKLVPDCFYNDNNGYDIIEINQHYMHSLEEFYAHVQNEWNNHLERTNKLIGTDAGTIYKK